MKEEIKEKWVTALDSGEYEKAEGMLRHGDRYCAMGVLGDLYVKEGLGRWVLIGGRWLLQTSETTINGNGVGWHVLNWAGMLPQDQAAVTALNDGGTVFHAPFSLSPDFKVKCFERKTFPEIAVWVKENL